MPCHKTGGKTETWVTRPGNEIAARWDAGPEPTGTYLRRVSDAGLVTHHFECGTRFKIRALVPGYFFVSAFTGKSAMRTIDRLTAKNRPIIHAHCQGSTDI